jgi:hypothetical protein
VFHVGIEKALHFALQRPVLKHRVIPTPRPTVPGFRFTELLFFSSGSGVSDTLEKGEMRVDYAPA